MPILHEHSGRERRVLAPGAVHVPDWLDLNQQRRLVVACREWASEGPGIRAAVLPRASAGKSASAPLPNGGRMTVRAVCLGWHWYPYRYSRTRDDQDGSPVTRRSPTGSATSAARRWSTPTGRRAATAPTSR